MKRRQFLHLASGAAAQPALSGIARGQSYPSRPITMIVPFAVGGGSDVVGRIMAEQMRETLGQRITVENVVGAAGSIGTGRVARAAPDGHTVGLGQWGTHVLNGAVYSLTYDVLNDFEPVSSTRGRRKKEPPGKGFDGIDRVVEGEPREGIAGHQRDWGPIACGRCVVPTT